MTGMRAGYDSVNRRVDGGRYVFRRSPIAEIRAATTSEAQRVVALLGEGLGERYVDLAAVRKIIAGDEHSVCLIATTADGTLVGAATAAVVDVGALQEHLPVGQENALRPLGFLRYHHRVGHLKSIVSARSVQKRGVASELVDRALGWIEEAGATAAIGFAWTSDGRPHIASVFEGHGLRPLLEVPDFWSEDARVKDYDCPSCRDGCHCSAVVFGKSLTGADIAVGSQLVAGSLADTE